MRKLALFFISLFLLAGSLVASLGTKHIRDYETRGYVDATVDQSLPYAVPRPGVNVDLRQYDGEELESNLALIAASGFVWVRQFVYWDEIEFQRGAYDWSAWDTIMESLRAYPQLEPVVVLMNTPVWARVTPANFEVTKTAPPQSLSDFADFAAVLARRYGDAIDYYQIWDEPNLDDAWGMLQPRPAEYVALLDTASRAIRAADSGAKIVAAGLAPTTETHGQNISDLRYLDAMYRHGAADMIDVVAGKPYGFSTSALDRRVDETILNFSRIVALREVMLLHGDDRTSLWASNWGWNALPPDWSGDDSIWGSVTADQQIKHVLQAFDRVHRELPWLGAMMLQQWQPNTIVDSAQWGFSLLGQDGTPTPLLDGIQRYNFPKRAQNGLYHPRNQYARYSGLWQFSDLGADIGWLNTSDSRFEFDFYGSDIALLLREDDYVAFLYPQVDGFPPNATAQDSDGNGYIFLRSDSHEPEENLVAVSKDLELGSHTLQAVADRGWDRWAIAGFAVSSGNLTSVYDRQIAIGALASALSLLVFLGSALTTPWRRWLPGLQKTFNGMSATLNIFLSSVTSVVMLVALSWTWTLQRPSLLARDEINILLALLSGGLLYLSPSVVLTFVAAIILFVLIYDRLENGLILTLFWAPFFLLRVQLYQFAMPMVEVMILITAAAASIRLLVWLGTQYQLSNSAFPMRPSAILQHINLIDVALAGMAIIATVSFIWTRRPDVASTELRTLILEPLLFYAIFRVLRPDKTVLARFVLALVCAGLLVSAIGLLKYFIGDAVIVAEGGARRLISVYGSPNNVGLLLGRAFPFVLAFLLISKSFRVRAAAIGTLFVFAVTLLLTQSVGAILLGVPAALLIVLLGRYGKKAILPLIACAIAGIIGFALLTQVSARFANILDFSSGTNFFRLRLWESAIEIIRDHPVTGLGLDQFLYRYSGEYVRPDAVWDPDLSHPHNFVLDFWTRLSVVGLALFLMIQFSFWKQARRALAKLRHEDLGSYAIMLGLLGSMAALLVHGMIDNSVFVIDLAFIFMFQLAATSRLKAIAISSLA